jgi:tetratricopeptide (TPR) repeat protein
MAAFYLWTREGNSDALTHFQRAIELDPNFASAYGMAARCYAQRKGRGWIADQAQETAETARLAKRAVELGKDDAVALMAAGFALAYVVGDIEEGADIIDQALVLNPNLASAWMFSGQLKVWLGQPETAIERLTHALRLSPQDPTLVHVYRNTAQANFIAGRYVEAFSWAEKARQFNCRWHGRSMRGARRAAYGRREGSGTLTPTSTSAADLRSDGYIPAPAAGGPCQVG